MRANGSRARWLGSIAQALLVIFLTPPVFASAPEEPFDPGRVGFKVRIDEETSFYRVLGIYVLPKQRIKIEALNPTPNTHFALSSHMTASESAGVAKWIWNAPSGHGLYPIKITCTETGETMTLNVFVMIPIDRVRNGTLNGYRIGEYPAPSRGIGAIYAPPAGFVEVTDENRQTLLSPHFRLEQFLCKQESGFPKYLALRKNLLLKLERLLEVANHAGYQCSTFHIMSGYRTPYYNKTIGNVDRSRHLWGDAADIFIDASPVDSTMDDLNRDGRIDYRDAGVLYDLIDREYGKPWYKRFVGGLARYRNTADHGPFVHVDVRGVRARWGR